MNSSRKSEESNVEPTLKRHKTDCEIDSDLESFLSWCKSSGIIIDDEKVKITRMSTSHNYGMVAVKDIEANQVLAKISKSAVLEPGTTKIKDLLKKNSKSLKSDSNWSKLILSIMSELNDPNSKWSAYLKLFPNYDMLDLPMFWSESTFEALSNTCVYRNVKTDLVNMKKEFDTIIVPFIKSHQENFSAKCLDFEFYKQIAAFVMAYSFRDPNEEPNDSKSVGPMMVPVADILNHIAKNNAHLEFEENELVISSDRPIKCGEEVYNTYGEHSNTDLLHMYGFVEKPGENTNDSVEVTTECFIESFKSHNDNTEELMLKKIETLKELDIIDDKMCFIIGSDGILNEEECLHMLQIYSMTKDEFIEFSDNDFELPEDEEWDSYSLLNDKVHNLPIDWKHLLNECCQLQTNKLKSTEEALQIMFQNCDDAKERARLHTVKTIVDGHVQLLSNFIKSLKI